MPKGDSVTFKAWFATLPEEFRSEVKALHAVDIRWNWIICLFIFNWVVLGIVLTRFQIPEVFRFILYVTIGLHIHGLANFMHEGCHGNLFRSRKWDRLVGFLVGLPSFFGFTAYQVNHRLHHQHTRSEKDPDELSNLTTSRVLLPILFYGWLIIGMVVYVFHVPASAYRAGSTEERHRIVTEYILMLAVYLMVLGAAIKFDVLAMILNVWILPLVFAAILGNIRGWAEHMLTVKDHPLTETRTVTGTRLFSWLNINLNYHLEHHLFAGVPWYNLPKLHKLLKPEYAKYGVTTYSSYWRFLTDAFRVGVFGVVPR